jgi:hypothetical protein
MAAKIQFLSYNVVILSFTKKCLDQKLFVLLLSLSFLFTTFMCDLSFQLYGNDYAGLML